MQAGLLLLGATLAEAFLCSGAYRIPLNVNGNMRRRNLGISLRMGIPISSEPARLIAAGSAEAVELSKKLEPCGMWSVPPTMMTMFLDNPEQFYLVKGRVRILPVTPQGKPLGEPVTFTEGDYGVVPGGSYRWEVEKQTTKKSLLSPNEPIGLLGVKGWREEPPIKALQGIGTLSTQGLDAEDNLAYLKKLVADKGFIPKRAWEEAIQFKLDRDIYLASLDFIVTDKGVIVCDRVKGTKLAVMTETSWEEYDPQQNYIETLGSKRWRKDGNFAASIMIANKDIDA